MQHISLSSRAYIVWSLLISEGYTLTDLAAGEIRKMGNRAKFEQDIETVTVQLTAGINNESANKLNRLKDWLIRLHKENVVKINHSVMELVCAKYLILKGYDVQIEYPLNDLLICDLYSTKGYGNLIVEIETGFIPPDHALDPLTYISARLASKIVRYSSFAGKFALGVPPHYVLSFPNALSKPPRKRTQGEIEFIKKLINTYYQHPPVTEDEILNARLHDIYIIDVDRLKILEMDPEAYMKRALHKDFALMFDVEKNSSLKGSKLLDYQSNFGNGT